jgi:hypothetical protein
VRSVTLSAGIDFLKYPLPHDPLQHPVFTTAAIADDLKIGPFAGLKRPANS